MGEKEKRGFKENPALWRAAIIVAFVAGIFSVSISVLLIANYFQITAMDPLDNPALLELRAKFAEAPETDPDLVEEIRVMDLLARKAFFTSQEHLRTGGYLLLAGVGVLLVSLKLAARWKPLPPDPADAPDAGSYWTQAMLTRELIAFSGVVLAICALLAAWRTPLDFPASSTMAATAETPDESPAAPAESTPEENTPSETAFKVDWESLRKQWPSFRGPGGYGVAQYTNAPLSWDVESGENIPWNVETPLSGFNSPVVWDQHLFISGATEEKREVYCYDTENGTLRWTFTLEPFAGTPVEAPEVSPETGQAAPTMVVQGDRACAIFANGDLACLDFDGKLIWGKNLGVPENHYGHSCSLIAAGKLLFVQYDQNKNGKLFAFNLENGDEVWSVDRDEISWASPALIPAEKGAELILNSETDVTAYNPANGDLLWKEDEALDGEVAPSPAWAKGMVFCANEYAMASAIRLDYSGATVQSEIAWQYEDYLPEVASPVGTDNYFYIATSMGEIVCLKHEDGAEVWVEEFRSGFYSSPILVGDRIYLSDKDGMMRIFGTGDAWELKAEIPLGEKTFATPAFLDGRIYLRTETRLMCIGGGG